MKAELLYFEINEVYKDYYKRGAVVCDPDFADKWALVPEDGLLISEELQGVYFPSWQDYRFAPDRVAFLLARMAEVPDIPLNLNATPERLNYLQNKKYILQGDKIILQGDLNFIQIRNLVEELGLL